MLLNGANILSDKIVIYDDVWNGSYEYLKEKNIDNNLSWINSIVKGNTVPEIDYDYRKVYISIIPYFLDSNSPEVTKSYNGKTIKEISDNIRNNLDFIVDDYVDHFKIEVTHKERYNLLRYKEGDFFLEHEDNDGTNDRKVSFIYYINDDYDGGEVYFRKQGVLVKPKAGQLLVFPSGSDFRHSISEVTKGTRYCIVSWAS